MAPLVVTGRVQGARRPALAELRSTNAPRPIQGPERGGTAKRPVSAQPRGTSSNPTSLPSGSVRSAQVSSSGQRAVEGSNGAMMEAQQLSNELLRILEERKMLPSPLKVSPHKEVAERASEECPRRPVNTHLANKCPEAAGTTVAVKAKKSLCGKMTPHAPSGPKLSVHARKMIVQGNAGSSRPRTAAPRIEQQAPQRSNPGDDEQRSQIDGVLKKRSSSDLTGLVCKERAALKVEPLRGSRERSFNHVSKENVPSEGAETAFSSTAGPTKSTQIVEAPNATGGKPKTTIADLIARYVTLPL